ncbi:hypothetical protein ORL59_28140 [Bacillus cereus]|uniref:hypothetical protein n=1 Tax=Bacillus cereus TaxID=1396 RepID=UPI002AC0BF8C|nr:hypothetical protein [Bacillus cereus]MDZ4417370.1 hypothetical protein [Bacillus cereus]
MSSVTEVANQLTQMIAVNGLVNFSAALSAGTAFTFTPPGTTTTINEFGLYYMVNLATGNDPSVFALLLNGVSLISSIGNDSTDGGNMSGGSVFAVTSVSFTIALQNIPTTTRTIVVTPGAAFTSFSAQVAIVKIADGTLV